MLTRRLISRSLLRVWLLGLVGIGWLVGAATVVDAQEASSAATPTIDPVFDGAPPDPDAVGLPPEIAEVLKKGFPRTVDDLRAIEQQVQRVLKKAVPATVGIQIGPSAGSGVIISPDGLVLTAGHVSGEANRDAVFIMPDGRRVRGRTLGVNRRIDSGLMRITEKGPWPYVEMARSLAVTPGQWVVATGHPGGFSRDRSPPVRLGRILYANDDVLCTDCTLVGGDSGGPLFNMQGQVIGIHSRIGRSVTSNFHVPIATYVETWDRLAAGEVWGGQLPSDERGQVRPYLGMHVDGRGAGIRVTQVNPNTPAARAGMQINDQILSFGGEKVTSRAELIDELWATRPGQRVEMDVQRGTERLTIEIRVGGVSRPLPGAPEYQPRPPKQSQRRTPMPEQEPPPSEETAPEEPEAAPQAGPEAQPESEPKAEPEAEPETEPSADGGQGPPDEDVPSADEPANDESARPDRPPSDNLAALGITLDSIAIRCVVGRVVGDSPADAAGIRAGDVITAVRGTKTEHASDLHQLLADGQLPERVDVVLVRDGREVQVVLSIGKVVER